MLIQLILLRHGIAEDVSKDGRDFSRRLTKAGISKLKMRLPHLKELITYPEETMIWTSPLVRAKETADILSEAIGQEKIIPYEFIGHGGFEELMREIGEVRKNCSIIIVGHEPYLGNWSWALVGNHLPFKKGAAASFCVSRGGEHKDTSLMWFLQPKDMDDTGKDQ